MSALKNSVLLRNRKAENRPLMKVICSLLLLALCLSALMISCCKYFRSGVVEGGKSQYNIGRR